MLELLDGVLLFVDDAFDQIADRQHADHIAGIQDRQVAHPFASHQ